MKIQKKGGGVELGGGVRMDVSGELKFLGKFKKKNGRREGGGKGGREGGGGWWGGQGGCERRNKFFVKIQKKKIGV